MKNKQGLVMKRIRSFLNRDIHVSAKNISQKDLIKSILMNEITICSGPAGTGKTFISLALALGLLRKESNKFLKIYLVKSVTTLKGEEIGFLKGDMNEKIEPFIWSFVLNVEKVLPDTKIKSLIENDLIRPFPLAYARGASIDNALIIADEVQNISTDNMRTLMTRIGEDSKLVLLGDSNQIDLRNKDDSSLKVLLEMFKNVNEIGCIEMNEKDVNIRNPIINKIEDKFIMYYEQKNGRKTR
jgi:phosphate starvation-inducible PhoH-like protein